MVFSGGYKMGTLAKNGSKIQIDYKIKFFMYFAKTEYHGQCGIYFDGSGQGPANLVIDFTWPNEVQISDSLKIFDIVQITQRSTNPMTEYRFSIPTSILLNVLKNIQRSKSFNGVMFISWSTNRKKVFLKFFAKFTGKYFCQGLLFIRLQA